MRSMAEGANPSATNHSRQRPTPSTCALAPGKRGCGTGCQRTPGAPAFRRQHPVGPFVLDFYCAKARLAIESTA
jgi:Protein of unknown function (DUF559)